MFQVLVRQHGGQAVWRAGLEVLKYPPTFCEELKSAMKVAAKLNAKN